MKKLLFISIILILSANIIFSQSGSLKGKIFDEDNNPMPFAHVYVEIAGSKVGDVTDIDGNYFIKAINPGLCDIKITSTGYPNLTILGVYVKPEGITFVANQKMDKGDGVMLTEIVVTGGKRLIDPGDPSAMTTLGAELEKMPDSRNLPKMLTTLSSSIKVSDDGNDIIIRGSRPGSSSYFVDGVKVDNLSSVPGTGIASLTVYTGGIPAKYGDITGGVVIIESKTYFDFLNEHNARMRKKKELKEATNDNLFNVNE